MRVPVKIVLLVIVSALAMAESGRLVENVSCGALGGALGECFAGITFLPRVIKSIRLKRAEDVSVLLLVFAFTGNMGWLLLGIDKSSPALMVISVIIMFFLLLLLGVKWIDHNRLRSNFNS